MHPTVLPFGNRVYGIRIWYDMVDQRIWRLYRDAKRTFEQERLQATQTINEKLQTLYDLGQILLDAEVDDGTVRKKAFESISQAQLQKALSETQQLIRPEHDAYVDYFSKTYNRVRSVNWKATLSPRKNGHCSVTKPLPCWELP